MSPKAREPFYVDNSTLAAFARCSSEAALRYGYGYTTVEERAPLKAGTAGHAAMAVWLTGGSKDDAMAAFAASYQAWAGENVAPGDRLGYENTSAILSAWFESHPLHAFPFRTQYAEIGFTLPLDDAGEIVFCGRMDGLVKTLDRTGLYVLENKFPGRINEQFLKQFRMGSQVSGYVWGAQQHFRQPVLGAYVNAVEFSKLPNDPVRKCAKHGVVYAECSALHVNSDLRIVERTPEQLESWRVWALTLARRYRRMLQRYPTLEHIEFVPQEGQFTLTCTWCGFHDFCRTGRQQHGMIQYEPWEPHKTEAERVATGKKP